MEMVRRTVPAEQLLEEYRALLQSGAAETLPLVISGSSMTPFLVHGRDTVYLSALKRPARRGDMLLYQRKSGAYILHRVHRVERDGSLTMLGDAQMTLEAGICSEQVIAIVTACVRKGKREEPGTFWWTFFARIWPRLRPWRGALRSLYTKGKALLGR